MAYSLLRGLILRRDEIYAVRNANYDENLLSDVGPREEIVHDGPLLRQQMIHLINAHDAIH